MLADLLCFAFVSLSLIRFKANSLLATLTGLSIGQAIVTAGFYDTNALRLIHHVALYILFPFFLSQAYARYDTVIFVRMGVLAALSLAAMNLMVMPFELMVRGGITMIYMLNFSGRAYELISILLLATSLATIGFRTANKTLGIFLLITSLASFSRGAIAVTTAILSLTWRRQLMQIITFRNFLILTLLVFFIYNFLPSTDLEFIGDYWLARLNIADGNSISSNVDGFLDSSDRHDIWTFGITHILEWPYFGTGIGTVSNFISTATAGLYAFSGYHNLSITILAERGIFLGSLFIFLLFFIMYRLGLRKNWQAIIYYVGFLLFAHTTGSEFILHSDHVRNANVLFFVFLLFLRLTQTNCHKYV